MTKRLKSGPGPDDVGTGVVNRSVDDRVWVSLGRKYRVAEYESLSVDLGVAVSLEPGEGLANGLRRVFAELKGEYDDVTGVMREEEGI